MLNDIDLDNEELQGYLAIGLLTLIVGNCSVQCSCKIFYTKICSISTIATNWEQFKYFALFHTLNFGAATLWKAYHGIHNIMKISVHKEHSNDACNNRDRFLRESCCFKKPVSRCYKSDDLLHVSFSKLKNRTIE